MAEQTFQTQELINTIIGRVRVLEGRYNLIREQLLVTNQNMIAEYKKILNEVKVMNNELKEIKREIFTTKDVLRDIIKEMEFFAKKENLKVLEKYINLWNPMNFMTEKEVENLIDEKLKKGVKSAK